MVCILESVTVELRTARGRVFSGQAAGVEMRTTDGVIAITPCEASYLTLTQTTQVTLRVGTEYFTFVLTNAAASLREGLLTVIAEDIHTL